MTTFDRATDAFTAAMSVAVNWKHHYFGAAYSTRLRQAVKDARAACDEMERILELDEAEGKAALAKMMEP